MWRGRGKEEISAADALVRIRMLSLTKGGKRRRGEKHRVRGGMRWDKPW